MKDFYSLFFLSFGLSIPLGGKVSRDMAISILSRSKTVFTNTA